MIRQSKRRFQARVGRIHAEPVPEAIMSDFLVAPPVPPLFIGDISCRYNARSPYLRCATNPNGPCEGCLHYESRILRV